MAPLKPAKILITGATGSIGKELTAQLAERHFINSPPQALMEMLLGVGFPVWQAEGLVEDYAHYARGEAEVIATGFHEATGSTPTYFDKFAADYQAVFKS